MSPNENRRIYKRHHTLKTIAGIAIGIAAFFLVLYVFLFFYFQRYIVHVEDGIEVHVPWLEETAVDSDNTVE